MKKLLVLVSIIATLFTAPVFALAPELGVYLIGVGVGTQVKKPVPFHLTEACQAKTLKTEGSNISYVSFEHCIKK